MNSSFIFQDSREYLIIVAVGDDHSAVNDLSPQVSLFHLQHVEYTAAYGYIDTSIAYQTTNFIDLWPSRINTTQLYAYCRQETYALSFIFIRFISVSGLPVAWLQLIDIKTYLSSFFLRTPIHTSDFQVYDIKPSYLLQVILCHRGIAHLIWNPSDTSSCSHSIKFSCGIIAISVLSYIKYLFWYIYHHHTFPSRVLYDSWSAI